MKTFEGAISMPGQNLGPLLKHTYLMWIVLLEELFISSEYLVD